MGMDVDSARPRPLFGNSPGSGMYAWHTLQSEGSKESGRKQNFVLPFAASRELIILALLGNKALSQQILQHAR